MEALAESKDEENGRGSAMKTQTKNGLIKVLILISAASLLVWIFFDIARAECCGKQTLEGMTGWIPNIIPGNVVVFYDVDGDGEPDRAQAFHIIDGSAVRDCGKEAVVPDDMFLFTTCPSEHAYNYWALRGGWECRSCMEGNFVPDWMDSEQGSGLE